MKTSLIVSLALLAFIAFSGLAEATLLPPGGSGPPDVFGSFAGATVLASATNTFSTFPSGLAHGSVTAAVFSDPTNVFGAGDLTFVYQISNDATSIDNVMRGTGINFTGFMTDVGYTTVGSTIPGGGFVNGTVAPILVDRSVGGDTVGFNFDSFPGGLRPGLTSYVLVIQTNAHSFTSGFFNVIDGGVATVAAFQPAVPDGGTTVALLGIALGGLEGVRRMFRGRKA
jgi:VPDSG-CTERM motif